MEVTSPPPGEHERLGVLWPLPPAGRRARAKPQPGRRTVNKAQEVPLPEAASGTMRRSGAPRGSRARGSANPGTPAVRVQPRSPGPAGRRRPPQPPGPAGPAPARVPALLGLGPWRLQPQRARLIGVESASGRFLHGPPLGLRPGSGPPPLSGWPRRRVRLRHRRRRWTQLREVEEAVAPSGRDHLGRKPRRAEISRGVVGNGGAREGGAGAGPRGAGGGARAPPGAGGRETRWLTCRLSRRRS